MRIGLFGGTFDPIHVGHLDVVRAGAGGLALDVVWLVPARVPPHRSAPHASASHRFAMAALAVQHEDDVILSDLEMDAHGPSYTAETLDRLQANGVDLRSAFFIIGADAFRDIAAWKDYPARARPLPLRRGVAARRPGAGDQAGAARARRPDVRRAVRPSP